MAGVQAHMKSFYPLHGSGRCSPALLEDLTLHSPAFVRRIQPGCDILRDTPINFTQGPGPLGAFLHPNTCRHEFLLKPRQSLLPVVDERPNAETNWSLAAICGRCRIHLHLKLDYSHDWQQGPCPNADYPLHHFIRAAWREGAETRLWEQTMLGSAADIVVYQCSAPSCSAILTARYTPQQLGDDMIRTLTDQELLKQRTDAAFSANPGNTQGLRAPSVIDVLSDLSIYLSDSSNTSQQKKRQIGMTNRRFIVRFGPGGDACKDLLEFLRFRRDEANGCWHVPDPVPDAVPVQSPVGMFLDDVQHELLALMMSRPAEEKAAWKQVNTGGLLVTPAAKEMQRLLSAQDYDTVLFHRGKQCDPAARPKAFIGLGIVPDAADHLIRYAYRRQVAHDPPNIPIYFECLRDVALERRSDVLQTEVGMEESVGRYTASALEQAHTTFGIGRQDTVEDETVIGMFHSRLMDTPSQESELRHHLRIIGSWRESHKILAVANNTMDTHEQALQFLGADASVSDDHIPALYAVKIAESSVFTEQAQKAVRLIANNRNSRLLRRWMDAGYVGDLSMDATEGYKALSIDDRQIDDESVLAAFIAATADASEQDEFWRKCLEAIALERDSATLKEYLQGITSSTNDDLGSSTQPVGLENIGNTCYLNSLLQFLFTLVELRQIVLDFDQYKMDVTEENVNKKQVGQRKITKHEVQAAQAFVINLGKLFQGMIQTPRSTIRPEKELARLTLETEKAKEALRRRSTIKTDRPDLSNLVTPAAPTLNASEEAPGVTREKSEAAPPPNMPESSDVSMYDSTMADIVQTPPSSNSSEATLVSRPTTPDSLVVELESIEQQSELLNNKENFSPTKADISPKHGDVEMVHPEPLRPQSPSKLNAQAGDLAQHKEHVQEPMQFAPPPGKPPPVPPRRPLEPKTDTLEEYARQQDVNEVLGHCLFQFSYAIQGTGTEASGEQKDKVHDMFFGQYARHTVRDNEQKESVVVEPFNAALARISHKPKDLYEALEYEYDLAEREGASKEYTSITRLPPVFSILLSRLVWDKDAQRAVKLDDHVELPETIFLDRYLEAESDSDLMQRRRRAWSMKEELILLKKRRGHLEEKVANGCDMPTVFTEAKAAIDCLQSNLDFVGPEDNLEEFASNLGTTATLLGAIGEDLAVESLAVNERIQHLEQQLKELYVDMRKHPYRLHAVFFHRGLATSGHYWVYIYDHKQERWLKYNDERVDVVGNLQEIFAKTSGGSPTAPYFLVYIDASKLDLVETVKRDIVYDEVTTAGAAFTEIEGWRMEDVQHHGPPQSQIQALPPPAIGQEMVQINGAGSKGGALCGSSNSDTSWRNADTRDPAESVSWDDSELTRNKHIDWSR